MTLALSPTMTALHSEAPRPAPAPVTGDPAEARSPSRELSPALLDRCRSGDPAALRAFILHHQGLVFAFLSRSLGRGPHLEDLAQEVFLRAYRALPRFAPASIDTGRPVARLSTWVLTIASRVAIDARRRKQIPTTPLDASRSPAAAPGTPETERRRAELGRALEAAAAALPAEQRDVFVLAEFHGLDMREIAAVVQAQEATVKTRLFRARGHLRALLAREWGDLQEETR